MESNRGIFPENTDITEEESIFPSDTSMFLEKEKREFIVSIAERYAERQNLSVKEAVNKAEYEGSSSVVPAGDISKTDTDIFNRAYAERMSVEDIQQSMINYVNNKRLMAVSKEDIDVAEKAIKDPLVMADERAFRVARLRTAIQKITPERNIIGKTWDFLGYVGREATYASLENIAGAVNYGGKTVATEDWYKRLFSAPLEEVDAVSAQIAKEMADYGIIGSNIFYLSTLSEGVLDQTVRQNEVIWSAVDIATLGGGKALRTLKAAKVADEVLDATRVATAVDPADMKIATNGVVEGDKVVLKALVDGEETAVELARQTSPGISRIATVNAENAVTPTLKPVVEVEGIAKINSVLEKTLKIFSPLRATPEVISKSAAKYVEDLNRTTGYNLLNVTRDVSLAAGKTVTKVAVKTTAKVAEKKTVLLEGVDPEIYAKTVADIETNGVVGQHWSISKFMKDTGLSKEESFKYKQQLRNDKIIGGGKDNILEKKVEVQVPAPVKPVEAPVTATAEAAPPSISVSETGFDSYNISVLLGNKDGRLWKTEDAARKAAEQLSGTVVKVVDGWAVKRERNLPIEYLEESGLEKEQQALRTFLFESILSPETTTNLATEAILKSGTSRINAVVRQIGTDIKKSWKTLSRKEKDGITLVVNDLTSDYARRTWYNTPEFKDSYFKHTGSVPSKAVMEHYRLYTEMFDTAYILRADKSLKMAMNDEIFVGTFNGLGSRKIKRTFPGEVELIREGKVVKQSETIFDLDSGKLISAEDLKGKPVYQLMDEGGITIGDYKQFLVTGSLKNNRSLTHADILGYKPGSNRTMDNASHFVIQDNIVETVSGKKVNLTPKTIVAERNTINSGKAAVEINNILKAVRDIGIGDVEKLRAAAGIDDVIRANNSFNPNIEDVDDFLKFMDEAGLNYSPVRVETSEAVYEGRTFREIYDSNSNPVYRRPDLILHGYGAKGIRMRNPFEAIERDFSRGINIASSTKYFDSAISNFIEKGKSYIANWEDIKGLPKYQQIRQAVITTDSNMARAFKREQSVILSRFNEATDMSNFWSRRMTQLNGWIFSKFGIEEFGIGGAKIGPTDFLSSDPTTALRGFAFDLKMGWFAVDQLYMQSLGALAIMTIDPKHGLQGAMAYRAMRAAITNRNPAVIKELAKRSSKMLGMTEDEFIEMTDHLYNSGRFDIGDTIAEIGGGADFGLGYYKRAKEAGRIFFKEGERVPRLMSHFVAYKNFKEKFPNLNVKTPEGARIMDEFITQRADTLTMNMSSVSNSPWQKGFLGLTTQWLSYNVRFFENVFLSRTLTKGERGKLLLSQLVFFGAAGAGVGGPLNYLLEETDTQMPPEVYTGIRYGILDFIMSSLTGEQTSLGGRAGLGEGVVNIISDTFNEGALETLMGPATGIGYDAFKDGWNILTSVVTGDITMAKINVEKFLRNSKTVDKIYQTMWAFNTQDIITKKGFEQIRDASTAQIVLNALAIPLQEAQIGFTISDTLNKQREYTKKMANLAKDLYRRMGDAYERGDTQAAKDIADEINTIRFGIVPSEQDEFNRMVKLDVSSFAEKMINKAWQSGKEDTALRSQKILSEE